MIPGVLIAQAQRTGCPLDLAVVVADIESGGGRNIWGRPPGPCGQPHNSPVTQASYRTYLAARATCGTQGVGPMQLTWGPLQDVADGLGGCWVPEVNVLVGLTEITKHLRGHTYRDALSLYNTGRTGQTPYSDRALERLPHWQRVIEGSPPQ